MITPTAGAQAAAPASALGWAADAPRQRQPCGPIGPLAPRMTGFSPVATRRRRAGGPDAWRGAQPRSRRWGPAAGDWDEATSARRR